MALHSKFPDSPYEIAPAEYRWFPAAEELRSTAYDKLLPPLVANIRKEVEAWRKSDYKDASPTSQTLLRWWFNEDHPIEEADGSLTNFRYYFAQREAVETVIWLYDVKKAREEIDLPQKMARLRQWCADATAAEETGQQYDFVFVDQIGFNKHAPKTFAALPGSFLDYRTPVVQEVSNEYRVMANSGLPDVEKLPPAERLDRACELYAAGKISRGPGARLAGLSRDEFDHELYVRNIPSYTMEMYEQDLETLRLLREESPQ